LWYTQVSKPNAHEAEGLAMSIPQAIPNVQAVPGLSVWRGNSSQPFVLPVPNILTANSHAAWLGEAPSQAMSWSPTTVRVNGILLFQETVQRLKQAPWSKSPLNIARAARMQGQDRMRELPQGMLTQHALMVAWGEFAHEIGLIPKLLRVPIPQKSVVHTPQGKVLTFLMGILTGITHLKDLNEGPHPLAHDWPAIRAWDLDSLAHYSGVSRTLTACGIESQEAIIQVLHGVEQPFIDREVELLLKKQQALLLDLDLTHRQVSNTSTTYPDAEFGWQDDKVGLGYDAALVTMTSQTYGRLFLSGFHHPRNTISLPRLQKMVYAAEARLGRRPRRRTERLEQRLHSHNKVITRRLVWLEAQLAKKRNLLDQQDTLPQIVTQLEREMTTLETTYQAQGRKERPYSKLAKARRRLASARRKLAKIPEHRQKAEQAVASHRARLDQLEAERTELKAHLARLKVDNEHNPDPVPVILRLDAGFGTGPNLAWLIEMGYIIYTKAFNAQVAAKLRNKVQPGDPWTAVGRNADMVAWDEQYVNACPYPLTMALQRFHTPRKQKHSTLIVYRDDGQQLTLPAWFNFYNGRQTIEAGIKETNVVFKMHPLKMRSPGGIALQEQFVIFAANFVRFAAVWLRERVFHSSPKFNEALTRVKAMVRVGANTSAWVVGQYADLLVKFDDTGAYPGVKLRLAGSWRTRPPIRPHRKVRKFDFRNDFASGCT
jgi:hypothetical protein